MEKVLVLSDIHSNHLALEVVYSYLKKKGYDRLIFLGDLTSDCPYPELTLEIIDEISKKYPCHFIRGNREDYLIDYHDNKRNWESSSTGRGSLLYTYNNLKEKRISEFKKMPMNLVENSINFTHGSPGSTTELLHVASENADRWLNNFDKDIFCGHTHRQGTYRGRKISIYNCGSVGISLNNPSSADFAELIIKDHDFEINYKTLAYDSFKLFQEFKESGLFDLSGYWARAIYKNILTAKPITSYMLRRAFELAKSDGCFDDIISEKYWEQAAREFSLVGDLDDIY